MALFIEFLFLSVPDIGFQESAQIHQTAKHISQVRVWNSFEVFSLTLPDCVFDEDSTLKKEKL